MVHPQPQVCWKNLHNLQFLGLYRNSVDIWIHLCYEKIEMCSCWIRWLEVFLLEILFLYKKNKKLELKIPLSFDAQNTIIS